MQAIGDSLARGLGMMGALAIIRFRTVFKDPRDIIFIFAAMTSGIACGVFGFSIAIIGTLGFCGAAFILYYLPFGQTRIFDGMLRFNLDAKTPGGSRLEDILKEYCSQFALISLRDVAQGTRIDYAYHVKLRKDKDKGDFMVAIKNIETISGVQLLLQETTVEI
jgi:hypothetical protein